MINYNPSNKIINFDLGNSMSIESRLEMISGLLKNPKLIVASYKGDKVLVLIDHYQTEILSNNTMAYYWPYLFTEDEYIAKGTYEDNGSFHIDRNLFLLLCYLSGLGIIELDNIYHSGKDQVLGEEGLVIKPTSKQNNTNHMEVIEKAATTFHIFSEVIMQCK